MTRLSTPFAPRARRWRDHHKDQAHTTIQTTKDTKPTKITRHFILATAGHVDHGKSALVKALTGTDPDRLPEEKARQITIELGFAQLHLTGQDGNRIYAGIVDVPGHEDFVRNMIAGVGSIDLALLVVAADDGWMPQTEEHLQILTYLGVRRAVIALTKSDLGRTESVTEQIRSQLRGTDFARSPVIPTSVRADEGIENLKSALTSELSALQPQRDFGKPRLFIDRAFTLRGIGTVVTGTLTGGQLHRGQNIVVQPQNFEARIRSIQSHGSELEFAEPGMRTAINLPDLAVGDGPRRINRGDVVTLADFGMASSTLVVLLEKSPRIDPKSPAARAIKNGASVYLHHGTSRSGAKVSTLQDGALEPGKRALAKLKLQSPVFAFLGDRFVLRDPSERYTIGGGVIVDPDDGHIEFRDEEKRKELMARATTTEDVHFCVHSEVALRGFAPTQSFLRKSHFTATEIADALVCLQRHREIVVHERIATKAATWQALRDRAALLIDTAHKKNPERVGLELNELRAGLRSHASDVFDALIADLCARDFFQRGAVIARRSHRPALPVELKTTAVRVRELLSEKPVDPPARRAIELDARAHQVLRFLIEAGEVIEVAPDVVLLAESFDRMKSRIADFISKNGPATVSDLRQALGSSRRIIVPLLEKLDRDGVTRRFGDKRMLLH